MASNLKISFFIFLFSVGLLQNKLINGTVIDCKTNLPIPGAEIIINKKELNQESKFTNFDGYFEIEVPTDSDQILIKYPKYKEIKISISKFTSVRFFKVKKRNIHTYLFFSIFLLFFLCGCGVIKKNCDCPDFSQASNTIHKSS